MSDEKRTRRKPARKKKPAVPKKPLVEAYGENALWECRNRLSNSTHHINGALAQILKHYPEDYELTFISPEGA